MGSEKSPPRRPGDIKQAFHGGVLAALVGSWHPARQRREGRESKCVGGGDGPAIGRMLAGPGPRGRLPSCGMSSCRETGTTWGGGGGWASRKLGDRGSGEQVFRGEQGQAFTPPTLPITLPLRDQQSRSPFQALSRKFSDPADCGPLARGLADTRAPAWPNLLSPELSLSRVPQAKGVGCSPTGVSSLGAPAGTFPTPSLAPPGPLRPPPTTRCSSSLLPRVWRRQRRSHRD